MQKHKSPRHVAAANVRWRIDAAEAEREAGIPDRTAPEDVRQPFDLPLLHLGYKDLRIEPRRGFVGWRAIDLQSGEVIHTAALKEMFRWAARKVPRMIAARNFH